MRPEDEFENTSLTPSHLASRKARKERAREKRRRTVFRVFRNTVLSVVGFVVLFVLGCYAVGFGTPWGQKQRLVLAETIISTRHYYLAQYITTKKEYNQLAAQLHAPVVASGIPTSVHVAPVPTTAATPSQAKTKTNVIEVHPISGKGYNGYVMLVHDPRLVRLVPAVVHGAMGQYITDIAKQSGAVAGTNASGFEDPNGNGWGGIPVGLEMVGGQVIHAPQSSGDWATVGFTKSGLLVMGHYSVAQLRNMGVQDAMQFHPELVVNSKPMITVGDGGWGYGPRTAIGQAKDGTVIFVVINGRFEGGSGMGASQRQVMDIMLQYGAVNACAMDGGSSSVLYHNGKIINSPSTIDPNGQRHLPDAWMVFPTVQSAAVEQAAPAAAVSAN
ncbi:phosphodiester glycosidase family protein [Alicyclobacillus mengziensis]|uniref:Phosphodiester glycosidase family protein n=1 Tax=Alicyclobacillus mengziensis TaxID=2931921 RepID=A0A9X7W1P4_9BACL|nr:phosphodiester glycosidase family protein [Alicyclobacillus mengziensis]QSO49029.1 phosphodiester glycosidase family protein [Alicyclobacillus mengziensis]